MSEHGTERDREYPFPILVTRSLTEREVRQARSLGLELTVLPAIRIEFPDSVGHRIERLLVRRPAVWMFTSANGVDGVSRLMQALGDIEPPSHLYAVGEKTAERMKRLGWSARVPARQDGTGLAERILQDQAEGLLPEPAIRVHWCGNRSRKDLPKILRSRGAEVETAVVYRTELNRIQVPDRPFRAVLFYSPSAVEAFRISGGFEVDWPRYFAIGPTTAEAVSLESGRHVEIPHRPSTEALLKRVAAELRSENTAPPPETR